MKVIPIQLLIAHADCEKGQKDMSDLYALNKGEILFLC
jgi:hypothetical protein